MRRDAIFFFSYGKLQDGTARRAALTATLRPAEPAGWAGGTIKLGQINGISVNKSTSINRQPLAQPADCSRDLPG